MIPDIEKLKFGGKCHRIAEEELSASLSEDRTGSIVDRLYSEYLTAGKPRNVRQWIKEQLERLFLCAGERPVWVGPTSMWAFLDGKPMVFIRQFQLGHSPVETSALSPGTVLYIFGLRVQTSDGFEMHYRVVQDDPGTKSLRMIPRDPAAWT